MFRKHNKKIMTAILVIVVVVGLIGPGVLLIFGNRNQSNPSLNEVQSSTQPETTSSKTEASTSSVSLQ